MTETSLLSAGFDENVKQIGFIDVTLTADLFYLQCLACFTTHNPTSKNHTIIQNHTIVWGTINQEKLSTR